MTGLKLAKNEVILLGILALLAGTLALLPWKKLILSYNENQRGKYAYANLVRGPNKPLQAPATWRVNMDYSPEGGTLLVHLSHRYDIPTKDLWLHAEFSSDRARGPVAGTVLRNQSKGVYRSDNVRLTKGEWVMSITGAQRSEFLFRLEQPLRVN